MSWPTREAARAYYREHRKRILALQKTPEQAAKRNARRRAAYANLSPEAKADIATRERAARALNPEPSRAYRRRWRPAYRAANLEEVRAWGRRGDFNRRARLAEVAYEAIDPAAIYARDKRICHICGKRVPRAELSLDHLIPLAEGGPHMAANLAVAHRSCNSAKGARAILPSQLRLVG